MTKDEALKLALEAMTYADACLKKQLTTKDKHEYAQDLLLEAGTAIKEALAQTEQEPVAFVKGCNRGQWEIFPAKAYQIFEREQPLYTTPPQRKPLTAMEVYDVVHDADLDWHTGFALGEDENRFVVFARAIEAAHGIKGEA